MPYVNVDDVKLYYEDNGSGLPLIFVHPPGMGHVVFHEQVALSGNYRVIMFDMRGHGRSEVGNREFSISLLADDLLHLMNELVISEAVLIGYSSGGSVVQDFAIRNQARVAGVILCGGFSEVSDIFLNTEFRVGKALVQKMSLLSWILAKGHARTEAEFKMLRSYITSSNRDFLEEFYEKGRKYFCTNKLGTLQVPFLHISGERAYYFHHYQNIYEENVPQSIIVRVANAFHELPTKSYLEFNHIVRNFVTSIEANRR